VFECSFVDADLTGANLYHAAFRYCRLGGILASGSTWCTAIVLNCDLRNADLADAQFDRADLRQSCFCHANLTNAGFQEANLNSTDFEGADLTGARFHESITMGANFRSADLRGASGLTQTQLTRARTDARTILPNGSHGPFMLGSGAHRPCRL